MCLSSFFVKALFCKVIQYKWSVVANKIIKSTLGSESTTCSHTTQCLSTKPKGQAPPELWRPSCQRKEPRSTPPPLPPPCPWPERRFPRLEHYLGWPAGGRQGLLGWTANSNLSNFEIRHIRNPWSLLSNLLFGEKSLRAIQRLTQPYGCTWKYEQLTRRR